MVSALHSHFFYHRDFTDQKPYIVSSRCLLGEAVRYDGGSKHQPQIDQWLLPYCDIGGICPEVEAGLSTPRPPVRLIQEQDLITARGVKDPNLNVTTALSDFSRQQLSRLQANPQLAGMLLKARSPSCGLGTTPLYSLQGQQRTRGSGLFASAMQEAFPWLCFGDETVLQNKHSAQYFLLRLYIALDISRVIKAGGNTRAVRKHYLQQLAPLTADLTALEAASDNTRFGYQLQQLLVALTPGQQRELLETSAFL